MPLYEYRCETCGAVFEKMQKFSDTPLTVHEGCGGPVERLISPPALQFKGTGWYITDYARKNGNSPSHAKHTSENGTAAKTESKEKPASKAESKPA